MKVPESLEVKNTRRSASTVQRKNKRAARHGQPSGETQPEELGQSVTANPERKMWIGVVRDTVYQVEQTELTVTYK